MNRLHGRWPLFTLMCICFLQQQSAVARPTAHLYVTTGGGVARFPLVNGIPASRPDLTIPGYGTDVAVGGDGTLYAEGRDYLDIYAFPYGWKKPNREIEIPPMNYCESSGGSLGIDGFASDRSGNLYLALSTYISGAHVTPGLRRSSVAPNWILCEGVAIFAPDQRGHGPPRWEIQRGGQYWDGACADPSGDVYLADSASGGTIEYANVFALPTVVRDIPDEGVWLGCDEVGNVYINGFQSVSVYAAASSSLMPRNIVTFEAPFDHVYDVAATSRFIYANDGSGIQVYDAHANGKVAPLFSLSIEVDNLIAVGP